MKYLIAMQNIDQDGRPGPLKFADDEHYDWIGDAREHIKELVLDDLDASPVTVLSWESESVLHVKRPGADLDKHTVYRIVTMAG